MVEGIDPMQGSVFELPGTLPRAAVHLLRGRGGAGTRAAKLGFGV